MFRVALVYFLIVGAIAAVLFGTPALKEFKAISIKKFSLAVGLGFILITLVYIAEQMP